MFILKKENLEYEKGDIVYHEESYRNLKETLISDIIFEDFDFSVIGGKSLGKYEKKIALDSGINILDTGIYNVKYWRPVYVLIDGTKVGSEYKLYKKLK